MGVTSDFYVWARLDVWLLRKFSKASTPPMLIASDDIGDIEAPRHLRDGAPAFDGLLGVAPANS